MYRWADVEEVCKEVTVFGKTLNVPARVKYITVDADGTVCGWKSLPYHSDSEWKSLAEWSPCILGTLIMDDHIEDWYNLIAT